VLRFAALIMSETVDKLGTPEDFIGHVGGDDFIIIVQADRTKPIADALIKRFDGEVGAHYDYRARQQGYITYQDKDGRERRVPLMTMAIGIISPEAQQFTDIREITEAAAEARRRSTGK